MLHRSTSSRRRRASRSAASSPQTRGPRSGSTPPPGGRRASIAASCGSDMVSITLATPDRSPRHSLVPPDVNRSPRNSLTPQDFVGHGRSPRNSLVPDNQLLSPRNSLVPDTSVLSPRHSLVPESAAAAAAYNRSPRNSLVPETNRSPRHSLVPGDLHSSRNSLVVNPEFNRSPRNSLVPDSAGHRSPRHSIIPTDTECIGISRSADALRSPRGSIAPETLSARTSPRGSIAEANMNRSPRGSLASTSRNGLGADMSDLQRSPRGSLTLTFQEPMDKSRRSSADNPSGTRLRSSSPYRMSLRGPQVNLGYSGSMYSEGGGSRRASSSVSQQVSGDDQRRLCCESTKLGGGNSGSGGGGSVEGGMGIGISLTTYGSVTYQLKDANMEASGTCDFVCRALRIVNKTVVMTVVLVCLSTLPLLMLIMGIQYLRDCPREPHIPVYMVVGGSAGCARMAWSLWNQLSNRRSGGGGGGGGGDTSGIPGIGAGSKIASLALNVFLLAWFALGNYWILRIRWPDYEPTLYEPNRWCHRTLYVFSLVHLCVMYSVFSVIFALVLALAACQLAGCPWLGPSRYK